MRFSPSFAATEAVPRTARELRERFQQVAGAVMAKGVEDTAFYRYHASVALNEVGSDPGRDEHARRLSCHVCQQPGDAPGDAARNDDARHQALRGCPAAHRGCSRRCRSDGARPSNACTTLAARHRGPHAPSRQAEYLFYQTLIGAHPLDADRAWAYMLKAAREAKVETSWLEPNERYESGSRTLRPRHDRRPEC